MISSELMGKYKIQKVWSCSKRDETNYFGFVRAYIGECFDGSWLAVTTDSSWD